MLECGKVFHGMFGDDPIVRSKKRRSRLCDRLHRVPTPTMQKLYLQRPERSYFCSIQSSIPDRDLARVHQVGDQISNLFAGQTMKQSVGHRRQTSLTHLCDILRGNDDERGLGLYL